jgi:hypothetical protein
LARRGHGRAGKPDIDRRELARALGLLGHYGSNLKQPARVANTNGDLPAEATFDDLAGQVHQVRDAVMRALGRDPDALGAEA